MSFSLFTSFDSALTNRFGEKQGIAITAVIAALVLTSIKLVVGVTTGSLGVLAEAVNSALDLVAAVMTLFAVRVSDRVADESHPYGHGRFENISALGEAFLLLVACAWVLWEGADRLAGGGHSVLVTLPVILVMLFTMVIDWSRARALRRAAKRHRSHALEANALHFTTDLWSTAVVILGLILVWIGQFIEGNIWLARADSIAAMIVAVLVATASLRLGRSTISALVDTAPAGLANQIASIARLASGVVNVERVRARQVGNRSFVDLTVRVARTTTFADAHGISEDVEERVRSQIGDADVVVHVEPVASALESPVDLAHFVAHQRGVPVHDVRVRQVGEKLEVDMHVELDPRMHLDDAHAVASGLERDLLAADDRVGAVNTHLEAPSGQVSNNVEITSSSIDLKNHVQRIADRLAGPSATHEVRVYGSDGVRELVMHISFSPDLDLDRVHVVSAEIERAIRAETASIGAVLIHAEPRE